MRVVNHGLTGADEHLRHLTPFFISHHFQSPLRTPLALLFAISPLIASGSAASNFLPNSVDVPGCCEAGAIPPVQRELRSRPRHEGARGTGGSPFATRLKDWRRAFASKHGPPIIVLRESGFRAPTIMNRTQARARHRWSGRTRAAFRTAYWRRTDLAAPSRPGLGYRSRAVCSCDGAGS